MKKICLLLVVVLASVALGMVIMSKMAAPSAPESATANAAGAGAQSVSQDNAQGNAQSVSQDNAPGNAQSSSQSGSAAAATAEKFWSPARVCVLDFETLDTLAKRRILDAANREIAIPAQESLSDKDRESVNSVMQGFVRMIDAWDSTKTGDVNRITQADDNLRTQAQARELYESFAHGDSRPAIIGAEYLAAYLGSHSDVISCADPQKLYRAAAELEQTPGFDADPMRNFASATGATHVITGTVSDIRTSTKSFKGYGIETQTTNYELDVIVKVFDLGKNATVYSNVYTGHYREQLPVSATANDDAVFQNLMTSALRQAADDISDKARPGDGNLITAPPPATAAEEAAADQAGEENFFDKIMNLF